MHGSRFSKDGVQLIGPSKGGLQQLNEGEEELRKRAIEV